MKISAHFRLALLLLISELEVFHGFSATVKSNPTGTTRVGSITIRPVQLPNDLSSIRICRAQAFSKKKSLLNSEKRFVQASAVAEGKSECLVALHDKDDEIYGTADYKVVGREVVSTNNVFVSPTARGKGIGRALMQALEDKGHDVGAKALVLEVYTSNTPAISLYRSCGYQTTGIHRVVEVFSNISGVPLLVEMIKPLRDP